MSIEALLDDLRDIHLPRVAEGAYEQVFAPEPFVVLAVIVVMYVGLLRWHSGRWMRAARARLKALTAENITGDAQIEDGWSSLVEFAAEVGARTQALPLPGCVFAQASQVGPAERGQVLDYLQTALGLAR